MRRKLGWSVLALMIAAAPVAAQSPASKAADVAPGSALEADHFVRASNPHQWRASKLIGLDVYGAEGEKVGDIVDVLIDIEGNEVVVIGVGGFLGIARREVALPFKAVDWRYGEPPKPQAAEANTRPSSAPAAAPRRTVDTSRRGYPDFAFVRATKETLKTAPEFKYGGEEPK